MFVCMCLSVVVVSYTKLHISNRLYLCVAVSVVSGHAPRSLLVCEWEWHVNIITHKSRGHPDLWQCMRGHCPVQHTLKSGILHQWVRIERKSKMRRKEGDRRRTEELPKVLDTKWPINAKFTQLHPKWHPFVGNRVPFQMHSLLHYYLQAHFSNCISRAGHSLYPSLLVWSHSAL